MSNYDGPSIHRRKFRKEKEANHFETSNHDRPSIFKSKQTSFQIPKKEERTVTEHKSSAFATKNEEDIFAKKANRNKRRSFRPTELPKPLNAYHGNLTESVKASTADKKQGEIYERKINYQVIKEELELEIQDLLLFDGFQTPLLEEAWKRMIDEPCNQDSVKHSSGISREPIRQEEQATTFPTKTVEPSDLRVDQTSIRREPKRKQVLNRSLSGMIEEDIGELDSKKRDVSGLFNNHHQKDE